MNLMTDNALHYWYRIALHSVASHGDRSLEMFTERYKISFSVSEPLNSSDNVKQFKVYKYVVF